MWGLSWCAHGNGELFAAPERLLLFEKRRRHHQSPPASASTVQGTPSQLLVHTLTPLSSLFSRLEKNANALQKEAKAYLDAVRSLSASSTRIATTIDLFFGSDAGEQAMAATAYKRAVEEMEGSVSRGIVSASFLWGGGRRS